MSTERKDPILKKIEVFGIITGATGLGLIMLASSAQRQHGVDPISDAVMTVSIAFLLCGLAVPGQKIVNYFWLPPRPKAPLPHDDASCARAQSSYIETNPSASSDLIPDLAPVSFGDETLILGADAAPRDDAGPHHPGTTPRQF